MGMATLDHQYPALFEPFGWGLIEARFEVGLGDRPFDDYESIHAVPFVGDDCVVIRLSDGTWDAPGGSVERGESWREALDRELIEEAGAQVLSFDPFGTCPCRRPDGHEYAMLMGWAQVELVGPPSNPEGCEQVTNVVRLPVDDAAALLGAVGQPELADAYRFAAAWRARSCARPA